MSVRMQVSKSLVLSVGQSSKKKRDNFHLVDCEGLGFTLGLFISSHLIRPENFQPLRRFYNVSGASQDTDLTGVHDVQSEKVRLLCWIMTAPDNHQAKVRSDVGVIFGSLFQPL